MTEQNESQQVSNEIEKKKRAAPEFIAVANIENQSMVLIAKTKNELTEMINKLPPEASILHIYKAFELSFEKKTVSVLNFK